MSKLSHLAILTLFTLLLTGCGVSIDSNIQENQVINKNDINISFTSQGNVQKIAFKFDEIVFKVNDIDRLREFTITQKTPSIKAIFTPETPLPEGKITLYANIPFSNNFWTWHYGLHGTKSVDKTLSFYVDTLPPTIKLQEPNNYIITDTTKPLIFIIKDKTTSLKDTPTITINNQTTKLTKTNEPDRYSYKLNKTIDAKELNVTIQAIDKANNKATKTFLLKQDPNAIKSLHVSLDKTDILKDESVKAKLIATTISGEVKEIDSNITWITTPQESINQTNSNIITPTKDTTITLQAKYKNKLSNKVALHVKWIVNGHTLPPKPDEKINNSTLLGIDSNNNGVRDDVERAIYEKFSSSVRQLLLMQTARAHQSMLADPDGVKNAKKWQKLVANKNIACSSYLFMKYDIPYAIEADDYMKNILYNNKNRLKKYLRYNHALSGGVYGIEPHEKTESSCEFNVKQALKADGVIQ